MAENDISELVTRFSGLYDTEGSDGSRTASRQVPRPGPIIEALKSLIDVMLPGRIVHDDRFFREPFETFLVDRLRRARELFIPEVNKALRYRSASAETAKTKNKPEEGTSAELVDKFFAALPRVRELVITDIQAAYNGDPAALTYAEVQLSYPGLLAVVSHRLAHELYALDVPIVPRIMSEWTHSETGTDIHPGANIGEGFFIDHATGVVIGETAKIGRGVKLYQGVTLGAKSFPLDAQGNPIKHIQRHPTVEDGVVIYANATVLGGDTVIGKGSTIAGGVFLMESVPANSFVRYHAPELKIKSSE